MAGMILGVMSVLGKGISLRLKRLPRPRATPTRRLTLTMRIEPSRYDAQPAYGFALNGSDGGPVGSRQGSLFPDQPSPCSEESPSRSRSSIIFQSRRRSIRHGMELDSYYDGVHGWKWHWQSCDADHRAG